MSEDKIEAIAEENHNGHDVDIDRVEVTSNNRVPWAVRLVFGILGILFIASAFAAWFFRDMFDGHLAQALPWVIGGLAVLGVGAIVESITTELWMVIITGIVALLVTFLIVGRSQILTQDGALFVVDRFSGEVQYCTQDGCLSLKKVEALPKAEAAVAPEPAAAPADAAPAADAPAGDQAPAQ